MVWTRESAKKFLLEVADTLPPDVKSATEFILAEIENKNNSAPRVEVIDENHQRFNGKVYHKRSRGYYYYTASLHTDVYKFFNNLEAIPKGNVIHHLEGKDENNIENLQMMTKEEHTKLHAPELGKIETFTCKNCGKVYQSRFQGKNCFCSRKCKNDWSNKAKLKEENRIIKNCEWCGAEYSDWKHGHRKYCSKTCAKYSQWAQMKAEGYKEKVFTATTLEQAEKIRKLYSEGNITQLELAKMFEVSPSVIGRIVRGESYRESAVKAP